MDSVAELKRFSMYASLARLGHKYELASVFLEAPQRLRTTYTDDYAVWRGKYQIPTDWRSKEISPIEAVNLFGTTGQLNLLLTALYLSCLLPIAELLGGVHRADGTLEQLSKEDLRRCLEARDMYTADHARSWSQPILLAERSPGCTQQRSCREEVTFLATYPLRNLSGVDLDVFSMVLVLDAVVKDAKDRGYLCTACADRIADGAQKLCEEQ
ncbi:hypothetical protein C8T65DRAFT_634820 [Cerioporus squamosus]|nr:hypothetical protein C8T65DRAFT_634820 [Cerioporus squamosus]